MSKFDYAAFCDDDGMYIGVSKERHSIDQARDIACSELGEPVCLLEGDYRARFRTGRTLEGEPTVGWFLDYGDLKRSCPVWVFVRV